MSEPKIEHPVDLGARARIGDQINENLRLVYEETLKEDVPDRFADLLAQLRNKGHAQ